MPPPLDVDREQVRMLVLSVGVREAARQLNIAEPTVQAWAARGKWLAHLRPDAEKPVKPLSMQGATVATKPADALANTLLEDGNSVKTNVMAYAKHTTKYAAEMARTKPETALALAGDVKAGIQAAALAGGWQQAGEGSQVMVNIALLGMQLPPDEQV